MQVFLQLYPSFVSMFSSSYVECLFFCDVLDSVHVLVLLLAALGVFRIRALVIMLALLVG